MGDLFAATCVACMVAAGKAVVDWRRDVDDFGAWAIVGALAARGCRVADGDGVLLAAVLAELGVAWALERAAFEPPVDWRATAVAAAAVLLAEAVDWAAALGDA